MNTSHDAANADPTDERQVAPNPQSDPPSSQVDAKPLSTEAAEPSEAEPYWGPFGVEMTDWPPAIRANIAELINPTYRELVLSARPGLAQSTGISIVHLLWLEILDHIQLNDRDANDPVTKLIDAVGPEPRAEAIERHLRLVHAKLKASSFLLRLQEFKARCRSQKKQSSGITFRRLSAMPMRSPQAGKNDAC